MTCMFMGSAGAEAPRRYDIRVWQTDEGLPQNSVTAIAQTADGFLWVGTRGGLARFDGLRFTVVEDERLAHVKESPINALCVTRDGSLWIASEGGGLTRLHEGQCERFRKTEGLADNQVQCLLEGSNGSLWIGGETGLTRWREGRFTTFSSRDQLHNNSIKALCEDEKGIIRIATVTGLVSIDADGNASTNNFGIGPVGGILKAVCADRQGRLWVGALDGVLCLTDGKRGSYAANKTLPEKITTAIHEDRFGQLWIGTYGGLTRRQDGILTEWWLNKTGISDVVNTIFEDQEQNLWVGGHDGLYRLNPTRFVTLTTQDGLSYNNVTSVCEDRNGVMWFGTWGGGVNRWQNGQFTAITETNGLSHDTVLSLWPGRDGRLLVGLDFLGGLDWLTPDLQNDFPRTNKLIPAPIRVIYEDRNDTVWVGTTRGLNALRAGRIETYTTTNGLGGSNVTAICESRSGRLWLGTEAGLSFSTNRDFSHFEPSRILPSVYVNALFEDAATNLWVGTRGRGLSRINGSKVTNYTTRDGLFTDEIYEVLEDDLGYFWMTSRRGIFRVSRSQFDDFDAGRSTHLNCTVFGREDGLATVQCSGIAKPAGWKSPDGRLWFATIRGVVMVEPRIRLNDQLPTVAVEEVVVDQQALRPNYQLSSDPEPLVIPPGSNGRMEIHYTALSLQSPEKNRFKYRLADFDLEWIEAGHQRIAYYNNVPPGRYRFEVMACNNDGVWSKQAAHLLLRIEPHFWQTSWFRAAMVALPIAIVILIYRARVERLRELENLRIRIAADLHDDVGSRLTKMAMMTELADREMATHSPGKSHILNISRTVRDITRAMDEIVWTINPRNDTVENLASYIFHYAQEYFQNTGVRCRLDLPPDLPDEKMSTEERHNLFMAVKEALNNILKHAAATEVQIALKIVDKTMTIVISDNGRGYHALTPDPTGDGLLNMRRRLEKIGGKFEIARHAGGGTLVTMRLPVDWA